MIRKKVNKIVLSMAMVATLTGVSVVPTFANVANNNGVQSINEIKSLIRNDAEFKNPQNYEKFLVDKLIVANQSEKAEISRAINEFKQLSMEDQYKFIYYINNPQLIIDKFINTQSNTNKMSVFTSQDIIVRDEIVKDEIKLDSDIIVEPESVGVVRVLELMGIDIIKIRMEMNYLNTSESIVGITSTKIYTVKNYIPILNISFDEYDPIISSNEKSCEFSALVSTHFVHEKLPIQYNTSKWTLTGYRGGGYSINIEER